MQDTQKPLLANLAWARFCQDKVFLFEGNLFDSEVVLSLQAYLQTVAPIPTVSVYCPQYNGTPVSLSGTSIEGLLNLAAIVYTTAANNFRTDETSSQLVTADSIEPREVEEELM